MEALQGPTLAEIDKWHDIPMHVQEYMVRPSSVLPSSAFSPLIYIPKVSRIRHGVRALCYAQVDQQDWHGNQFICLPPDNTAGRSWEIVFIDFAFAFLPLGEGGISRRNTGELYLKLLDYLRAQAVVQNWFDLTEEECC